MIELDWMIILPAGGLAAALFGLVWKHTQDKAVRQVKRWTVRPGELHVSDFGDR